MVVTNYPLEAGWVLASILVHVSYNFEFWSGGDNLDAGDVCTRLHNEQQVPGVTAIDHQRVVDAFASGALTGWSWDGQFLQPPGTEPDDVPAFDVSIGDQLVSFVGYGWEPEHANAIIDAMHGLGLRLYDPQVGERFA